MDGFHVRRKTSQMAPFHWNLANPLQKLVFKEPDCLRPSHNHPNMFNDALGEAILSINEKLVGHVGVSYYLCRAHFLGVRLRLKHGKKQTHPSRHWLSLLLLAQIEIQPGVTTCYGFSLTIVFWCSCVWESQMFYVHLFFLNMKQNHNFISKNKAEIHMSCNCDWK